MFTAPVPAQEIVSFLHALELSRANDLARHGRLGEAESLVSEVVRDTRCTVAATDLLARIRVQQGKLFDAQKLWMDLARVDPTDTRFSSAVIATNRLIRWGRWYGPLKLVSIVVPVLVFATVLVTISRNYFRPFGSTGAIMNASLNPRQPEAKAPESQLPLRLNVPGAVIQDADGEAHVQFESGLFTAGTTFRPAATKMLEGLARQLGREPNGIQVIVEGHTDGVPVLKTSRFRDNLDLADARAEIVLQYLIRFGGISAKHVFLQRGSDGSYPKGPPDIATQDRTVVLRITRVTQ